MTSTQDTGKAAARPASGIVIVPEQLTRMRDRHALSREDLAERTGELLFDREAFALMLDGSLQPDARTTRALWLTLRCEPGELISGLPAMARAEVPRWLRRNGSWRLDLDAVARLRAARGWSQGELADAVARHWFSRDSVNKIERGERRPKARTLRAFCTILECQPEQMMDGSQPLPDGATRVHRDTLDYNKGMRAFADAQDPPIQYRMWDDRIRYTAALRTAYEEYLARRESGKPAS